MKVFDDGTNRDQILLGKRDPHILAWYENPWPREGIEGLRMPKLIVTAT
jgi:hypothetical protein